MTLIKKSDVKNHLSAPSGNTSIFRSGPTRPDGARDPAIEARESKADEPDKGLSPDAQTPETLPDPQAGDSVIPAGAGD